MNRLFVCDNWLLTRERTGGKVDFTLLLHRAHTLRWNTIVELERAEEWNINLAAGEKSNLLLSAVSWAHSFPLGHEFKSKKHESVFHWLFMLLEIFHFSLSLQLNENYEWKFSVRKEAHERRVVFSSSSLKLSLLVRSIRLYGDRIKLGQKHNENSNFTSLAHLFLPFVCDNHFAISYPADMDRETERKTLKRARKFFYTELV